MPRTAQRSNTRPTRERHQGYASTRRRRTSPGANWENAILANFAVVTTARAPHMQAKNSVNDLAHGNEGGLKAAEVRTDANGLDHG